MTMEWQNKRKPTDRTLEPRVLEKIPDAGLFHRMQEVESNLDALVQRKRLDLQDMIGRSMRKNETLRIFISSSIANQKWQEGTEFHTDPANPNWTLRIEGRLVHENVDKPRAFSSMITSVIVELKKKKSEDSNKLDGNKVSGNSDAFTPGSRLSQKASVNDNSVNTDTSSTPHGSLSGVSNEAITCQSAASNASSQSPTDLNEFIPDEVAEWHEACVPPEQRVDFDGLDIKRPGTEPISARILIQLKEYPDKFKLSPQLAAVLGVTEESKPGAVVSLWQYIRYHDLQDVDEKRLIKCNEPLFNLFKREKIMLPQLVELLAPHLSPREPIIIEYTVDPSKDISNRDIAFDVPIQVDHPLRGELLSMLTMWHHDNSSIGRIEDLLLQDVQALNLLSHQHDFYEQFSKDPITFLDRLVASQARDLKIIYCDRQFSEEAVRHSSFYTDDLLNPSVHLFLSKQ